MRTFTYVRFVTFCTIGVLCSACPIKTQVKDDETRIWQVPYSPVDKKQCEPGGVLQDSKGDPYKGAEDMCVT